ncbi:MAG TPA: TonB-dependent receptor [Kofleriaceae bacterium]|nr:TonB-dependent receptor [Kofleriaceae bacterium]
MPRQPTAALALIPALLHARLALAQPPPPQPRPAQPPPADRPPAEPPAASPTEAPTDPPAEAAQADRPEPLADRAAPDGEQKGEVIVIDSRSEKPLGAAVGAVDVVDRQAIRARGSRTVADALRGRIGLEVVPALRGTAVRAQGLDPTYTLILIDGLPAIGRIDGALDVDRLPVDGVERIEIMKGPSSALYGSDALGGVINIVSRDADRPLTAEGNAVVGSRGRADANLTAAGRQRVGAWRVATRAALGMRRSDGYDLDTSTPGTEGSEERSGDGALRLAATRGPWRIAAGGDYLRQDLRGVDQAAGGAVFDRRTLSENGAGTAQVSYQRESTRLSASLRHSVFHDQFLLDQQGSGELDEYELTDERLTSAAMLATSLLGRDHLATAGADGSAEGLSAARLEHDGSRERLGVYAQDEWMVVGRPQVILVPGVRLDLDTQFGAHATPKLNARWDVSDRVVARASAGLGYRAPDFRQLQLRFDNPGVGYRVEGNPDLEPETSVGETLSVDVEPIDSLSLAAQGYWNEIDNLIVIEPVDPDMPTDVMLYSYSNVGSARTRGVELQARAQLGRLLSATVGYTLADTLDREADHELPDRARHRGSFELRAQPIDRVTVAAHGELVGRRFFYSDADGDGVDEPQVAGRYAWIGARAEIAIGDNLSLYAGADNLTDAGDSKYLPVAPRAFYAGLRGHYERSDEPAGLAGR